MSRIESSSSINTYRTCQRKYFYRYKLKLPSKESIAALTGKAVHTALENFFKYDLSRLQFDHYENQLRRHLLNTFNHAWMESVPSLSKLGIKKTEILRYYQDSLRMLDSFITNFLISLSQDMQGKSLTEAFTHLAPESELFLQSEIHKVRGFIDAIHTINGETIILDYKTTRKDIITDDYKLQLAIYYLLYEEKYGKAPDKVGLYFLRHGTEKYLPVSPELLAEAKEACTEVHEGSVSEKIEDYNKTLGGWCRWCDYKDVCFGQKSIKDFEVKEIENESARV